MRTLKEEEVSLNEYEDMTDARAHLSHFLRAGVSAQEDSFLARLSDSY